jgi:hypothetical protein
MQTAGRPSRAWLWASRDFKWRLALVAVSEEIGARSLPVVLAMAAAYAAARDACAHASA